MTVNGLALALRVAFAKVTDEDVENVLLAVDLNFSLVDFSVSGHHDIAAAKDIDFAFDHLTADAAVCLAFDDDSASLCVSANVDICISFNNNSSAVHERTQVRADISHEVAHLGGGQDRADIAGLIELEKALEEQIKRMKGK